MLTALDTHSPAYHLGENLGRVLIGAVVAGVGFVILKRRHRERLAASGEMAPTWEQFPIRQPTDKAGPAFVALVAVAVVAWIALGNTRETQGNSGDGVNRALTVPATVLGYTQITGPAADRLAAQIPNGGDNHPRTLFYGKTSDAAMPSIVVFADSSSWNPSFAREQASHSSGWELDNFFAGVAAHGTVTGVENLSAGPFGGSFRCANDNIPGHATMPVCAWSDSSTFVSVELVSGEGTIQDAVDFANALRSAAER